MPAAILLVASLVADRAIVVGRVGDGPWTDAPTAARTDQKAELAAVVIAREGKRRIVLVPTGVDTLVLGRRKVPARELATLTAAKITWSTVEPHGFRSAPAAHGATSEVYSNVSTEGAT